MQITLIPLWAVRVVCRHFHSHKGYFACDEGVSFSSAIKERLMKVDATPSTTIKVQIGDLMIEDPIQCFDEHGNHWIVATINDKRVRGNPVTYECIAELGPLRAKTQYFDGKETIYYEIEVSKQNKSVVTAYDETANPKFNWQKLWREETKKALNEFPLYESK